MISVEPQGIVEVYCDRCNLRLTEVLTGTVPMTKDFAIGAAMGSGWVITPSQTICYGCSNV
jgi:hypothetical protein